MSNPRTAIDVAPKAEQDLRRLMEAPLRVPDSLTVEDDGAGVIRLVNANGQAVMSMGRSAYEAFVRAGDVPIAPSARPALGPSIVILAQGRFASFPRSTP